MEIAKYFEAPQHQQYTLQTQSLCQLQLEEQRCKIEEETSEIDQEIHAGISCNEIVFFCICVHVFLDVFVFVFVLLEKSSEGVQWPPLYTYLFVFVYLYLYLYVYVCVFVLM